MKKIFFASLSVLSFLFLPSAHSQTVSVSDSSKIYNLSEIVVSATRTKTSSIEVASSISVIDSAEIAASNKTDMLDLLKGQYGLIVTQGGGPGQLAQVYMRGANPDQVLVEMNGVKMNMPDDPGNSFDFSSVPLDNIERIEILRGPQSTLYGSDATAGVINIITRRAANASNYFANAEGGSLGTYKGLVGASGKSGSTDYSVTLSKTKSDGIPPADQKFGNTVKSGYQYYNFSSNAGYEINSKVGLNFFAAFNKGKAGIAQHGGPLGDDPTYFGYHEQGEYRGEANINSFQGAWQQKVGVSFMRNLRRYSYDSTLNNPASSRSFYSGNFYQFDWENNFSVFPQNLLTLGLEAAKQSSSSDYFSLSSMPYLNFASHLPLVSVNSFSSYLQDQINILEDAFTTVGIRYDNYGKRGSAATFRITQAYLFKNTGTKLKATYGTGFKAPTLVDLYDPLYGNLNLKSERSTGWEAGVEQYLFNYSSLFGVTYFNNIFTDMFGYDNNFRTINIGKAQTDGIEISFTAMINESLRASASYTLTNALDKTSGSQYENLQLVRRPKQSASLGLNYNFSDDLNVNLNAVYVGTRYDVYVDYSSFSAARVQLDAYTLMGVSASYKVSENFKLYGRIENLLNAKYEEVYGFGTPGRTAYAGVKVNIK